MARWLAQKILSGRVATHIGLMKTDLGQRDSLQVAIIYAEAQLTRKKFAETSMFLERAISDTPVPAGMLDNPFNYERDDLERAYSVLEDIRNDSLSMQKQMEKNFKKRMGIRMQPHEELTLQRRGLEVLMCIVGVGLRPDKMEDLESIWRMLMQPRDILLRAFESLKARERLAISSGAARLGDEIVYMNIDDDDWLEACEFVPEIIRKERLSRIRYVEAAAPAPVSALAKSLREVVNAETQSKAPTSIPSIGQSRSANASTDVSETKSVVDATTRAAPSTQGKRKSHWLAWVLLAAILLGIVYALIEPP